MGALNRRDWLVNHAIDEVDEVSRNRAAERRIAAANQNGGLPEIGIVHRERAAVEEGVGVVQEVQLRKQRFPRAKAEDSPDAPIVRKRGLVKDNPTGRIALKARDSRR